MPYLPTRARNALSISPPAHLSPGQEWASMLRVPLSLPGRDRQTASGLSSPLVDSTLFAGGQDDSRDRFSVGPTALRTRIPRLV